MTPHPDADIAQLALLILALAVAGIAPLIALAAIRRSRGDLAAACGLAGAAVIGALALI